MQGDGSITDESGNPLLDTNAQPMRLSPADTVLTVKADGTLSSQNGTLGQVAVVAPNDPNRMTAEGGRLFPPGCAEPRPSPDQKIIQGALESSNVQAITEITRMIATERDFSLLRNMCSPKASAGKAPSTSLQPRQASHSQPPYP